ncbi:MAG: hypothetical protein MUF87_00115 [Anaerolineae bacterium]|nr:hypothetical protein [Anaerolineae bacterium]
MPHYPEQRYVSRSTVIRREVSLPEEATGVITAKESQRVDIREVIAQGVRPSRHVILDVAQQLGLRRPSDAERFMLVNVGDVVDVQAIAGRSATRGKRVFSPVKGIVIYIGNGQVIIQEMPQIIDLEAGVRGRIAQVIAGKSAVIETTGAQLQGVWGNDRRTIAVLRIEPEAGIESIVQEQLDMKYLGAVVVTKRSLKPLTMSVMEEQGIAGIIAPSMDYSLVEMALKTNGAILLTEGFGNTRMSRPVLNLLTEFEGQQVTLDAYQPRNWDTRRPEIIVNTTTPKGGENPSRPNIMLTLRSGMNVRITREPYTGQTARVIDLPKNPILLDNGLRVPSAQVELAGGEIVYVPLANLEVLGR